jgi:hypothetical protein
MTIVFVIAVAGPLWAFYNVKVAFPPMVGDDSGFTLINAPVNINLVANDADPDGSLDCSKLVIRTPPEHGIVTPNPQTGVCTYVPAIDYVGVDKFAYDIRDDEGVISNTGFCTVTVAAAAAK